MSGPGGTLQFASDGFGGGAGFKGDIPTNSNDGYYVASLGPDQYLLSADISFAYQGGSIASLALGALLSNFPPVTFSLALEDHTQSFQEYFGSVNSSAEYGNCKTPGLTFLNPFASYATSLQAPLTIDETAIDNAAPVTKLAADGESAIVLSYQSYSPAPVTFTLSGPASGVPPGAAIGSLGDFDPDYLDDPSPLNGNGPQTLTVSSATYGPDPAGYYQFLALLWAPNSMPVPNVYPAVSLTISAMQQRSSLPVAEGAITLEPPPLLLVHGIWSSADQAWPLPPASGFPNYLLEAYPPNLVHRVDYGALSANAFTDTHIQQTLLLYMSDGLVTAANAGMAARTVDVVGHSMGGLVTRYFLSTNGYLSNPALLANPIHKLITIGTPHAGTPIATDLANNATQSVQILGPLVNELCQALSSCTLGNVFQLLNKPVGSGVISLEPNYPPLLNLSSQTAFSAIVGAAPTFPLSVTESMLDYALITPFLPGQTVSAIMGGQPSDTIVPELSQAGGDPTCPTTEPSAPCAVTIPGIVHTNLCAPLQGFNIPCPDVGETQSPAVWSQAYYWLTGGTAAAPTTSTNSIAIPKVLKPASSMPAPVLDLSGYTQVGSSNATFLPATGSNLTINSASSITATSSTKTIIEVLLLQSVSDPTDAALLYATQSPFAISYTPTRLGSATFGAIAVFSDNTYATTTLNYTLQISGTPAGLNLINAPVANMSVGSSRVVDAKAVFASGLIDVTQAATYSALSGLTNVFSISSGGTITATGNGVDTLNVSYGGVTATAPIAVGACTYALNPLNQIVPNTGGTVSISVITQPGCAWTAAGGSAWLPLTQASGSGNGTITLVAGANSSGATNSALVTLSGIQATVTQPATACTYGLSQTQIYASAAGVSGTISVTTSCPVIASSNANWVTVTPLSGSVSYTVGTNDSTSARTAILTIGTQTVSVVQGPVGPALNSLAPASGTGLTQAFTAVYSDTNGLSDLNNVRILFNSAITGVNGCYVLYYPAKNVFYLETDADNGVVGPLTPGSSSSLSNSQCTLAGTGTSASTSSNTITVTYALTFWSSFAGLKNVYLSSNSAGVSSGWVHFGQWTPVTDGVPSVVSLTPNTGTGLTQTFTAVYSDPNGVGDLNTVRILFNSSVTGVNGCYVLYYPVSNALYLENDADNTMQGPLTPGASATLSNAQCTLAGAGTTISTSGNTLTVTFALTFASSFAGSQAVYLSSNSLNASSGWLEEGNWTPVSNGPPAVVSLSPNSGSGSTQTFNAIYSDPNGIGDLNNVRILFNTAVTGASGCYVFYLPVSNALYLENDADTALLGPLTPGASSSLSNSQCTLNGEGTTVGTSANSLIVNYSLSFTGSFTGLKNVYLSSNSLGASSGWIKEGSWTP